MSLEKLKITELKSMAEKMDLPFKKSKSSMIALIREAFAEYEEYKKEKLDKYTKHECLGKGKEGTTYLAKDKNGKEYAMKTFRPKKSSNRLLKEYEFQKRAAKAKIAPKVYDYDTVSKYIVMQKLDEHLLEKIGRTQGVVTKEEQLRILEILTTLDDIKIMHDDANLQNFMIRKGKIYLIDYGFAKEITPALCKKLGTKRPNSKLMTIGIIIKFKERGLPEKSYKYLKKSIDKEDLKKYGI